MPDTSIRWTDVAIVFATLIGPILAVQAQRFVDLQREQRRRRTEIFQTLMITRAQSLSAEHVRALNAIPVEFTGKDKRLAPVIEAWRVYLDHLGSDQADMPRWMDRRTELFVNLLEAMGDFLGYDFGAVELKKEIYAPRGHATRESDQEAIRQGVVDLLSGKRSLPMDVKGFPYDAQAVAGQRAVQEALAAWLRGETATRVRVDDEAAPPADGTPRQ